MTCPLRPDGVHDLGASNRCGCGYVLVIPPISFSVDVFDRQEEVINEAFNCDRLDTVVDRLRELADRLEQRIRL